MQHKGYYTWSRHFLPFLITGFWCDTVWNNYYDTQTTYMNLSSNYLFTLFRLNLNCIPNNRTSLGIIIQIWTSVTNQSWKMHFQKILKIHLNKIVYWLFFMPSSFILGCMSHIACSIFSLSVCYFFFIVILMKMLKKTKNFVHFVSSH